MSNMNNMDGVQSIFSQMRKSREAALNESIKEQEGANLDEGTQVDTPAEGQEPAQEPAQSQTQEPAQEPAQEPEQLDEAEEFVVIKCAECGSILSGLDEAEDGCPVCGSDDLDEKTVRVVRDGKVQTKKVSTKKRRLSAAQKAALAKARKKAHTAGAQKKRAKSNKVRNAKGMNEDDAVTCQECGFEGEYDEFDLEDDVLICPECGATVESEEE